MNPDGPDSPATTARLPLDRSLLEGPGSHQIADVDVEVVDQTASTNALVVERARGGAAEGLVIVADHQTAGRGRLDRTWETPARSAVTFSMLLRPTAPTRSWPWLPLLAGYAVERALQGLGFGAGVKWPNDVLIGERKVAGILVERIETADGPAAVLGVGLNASMSEAELPVPTATSLSLESGERPPPDRTEVLLAVLSAIRETYDAWQVGGDLAGLRLEESYSSACVTIGREVRVELPGGDAVTGHAVEVDPAGRLVVEGPGGRVAVGAGDVIHVRALAEPVHGADEQ